MINDRSAEERIRTWMIATAPPHIPDRVLTDTHDRTRRMTQASSTKTWWSREVRPLPIVFAAGAVAVVLIAVSVGFGPPEVEIDAQPASVVIGGVWPTDAETAVTIERDPTDDRRFLWRAAAYDRIGLHDLSSSANETIDRAPGTRLFGGMADDVEDRGREPVSFTIQPGTFTAPTVLSPATPVSINKEATTVGRDGYFASVERDGNGPYTVTALVDDPGSPDAPTESALRAAGTDYPAEAVSLYTAEVPGMFGPNLRALSDEIVMTSRSAAPYDVAQRVVEVLHGQAYRYDTDVRDIDCGTMSTAECFAWSKRGYCQHYATTMAVIMRDLGIPARVVVGFLPGERARGLVNGGRQQQSGARLGRGVLPGLRMDRVRPDRGRLPELTLHLVS